jgi:ABC-type transporter Mla subunit MlaD
MSYLFVIEIGVLIIASCVLVKFTKTLQRVIRDFDEAIEETDAQQERLEDTVNRMEAAAQVVAANLAANKQPQRMEETVDRMEAASHVVADNLASSVSRADATEGPDGAAADAALRTGDTAEAITQRQDDAR